ncbi:hypothetical protein CBR_g38348 [Chara braunii]|uniref:Uncharacterized protein n=1 Tax=Chara braunii TaxID=69332 RepID=A0A388LQ54_CHABU|nr:hypothetical protein CBR_g38348 [Chara braunii]|eukprot:GBG84375.1 hypothetical protein CBR_g38348 [Chara braunii]
MEVNVWTTSSNGVILEINGGYTSGKSGWGILGKKDVRQKNKMARWLSPRVYSSGLEMPIDVREGVSVVLPEEGTWTDLEPAYETVMLDEKDAFLWIETIWTKVILTRLSPSLMDLEFQGTVEARGWVYLSQDMENEMVIRLVSGTTPDQLFRQAEREVVWAACQRAEMEMGKGRDPGFDDVTADLRVARAGSFELPSENIRMRLPPFLLERLGGLELVRQAVADLAGLTYEDTMVHREYYRVFLEMRPFSGEQRYGVLRTLCAVLTTRPRAPVVSDGVLWGVVRREISRGMPSVDDLHRLYEPTEAREKQKESKEGEGTSPVGEVGSSEGGLRRIVATFTRALNKNQGYLADAKKKLTFDGANITEFLIDYENLAALLKWTEEEKMDHLGQHVSLSLGRDIMAIVSCSGSWKETRNEMMRKYLKAEKMATEAELAAVQRKNYATYNDFLRAFTLVALRIPGVTDRVMSKYFLRQFSEFDKDKILSAYQKTNKFEYTRDVDFSTVTDLAEKTAVTETLALLKEGEVIDLTGKTGDKVKKGMESLHERVHGADNKIERVENALLVMQAQVFRPALPPQEAVVPAAVANRGFGRRAEGAVSRPSSVYQVLAWYSPSRLCLDL